MCSSTSLSLSVVLADPSDSISSLLSLAVMCIVGFLAYLGLKLRAGMLLELGRKWPVWFRQDCLSLDQE